MKCLSLPFFLHLGLALPVLEDYFVPRALDLLGLGDAVPSDQLANSRLLSDAERSLSTAKGTGGLLSQYSSTTHLSAPAPTGRYSIIGAMPSPTIVKLATSSVNSLSASTSSTQIMTSILPSPSSTPSVNGNLAQTGEGTQGYGKPPEPSDRDLQQWKVIGVGVIAISALGLAILAIVFFDRWSRFFRDVFCGKKKEAGKEDLIPDWDKRSWEFKLAASDSHRYPILPSNSLQFQSPFMPRPTFSSPTHDEEHYKSPGGASLARQNTSTSSHKF